MCCSRWLVRACTDTRSGCGVGGRPRGGRVWKVSLGACGLPKGWGGEIICKEQSVNLMSEC